MPGYAALILRRTFRQLDQPDAIMSRSKEWLKGRPDAHWNDDAKRWTFPSGATLTFGFLESDNDVYNYQGPAYQFVGWDELTQFSEKQYRYLFSRTRRRTDMQQAGVPIRHRSASNPGGIGHAWVKARFINEDTRETQAVFIPAKVEDNPGLDVAEYKLSLDRLDEVLKAQLLHGDWGIFEGAAFSSFNELTHLVAPFAIPDNWLRFESLDHGVANPTCALAWCADYDGNLITFDSYYSPGLVSAHANALLVKRGAVGTLGWWPRDPQTGWLTQSIVSYADPSMWNRTGATTKMGEPASVVTEYYEHDVSGFVRANNNPRAGRIRMLELLRADPQRPFPSWHPRSGEYGAPRWFIVGSRCPQLVEQIRAAPVNQIATASSGPGEIVDSKWEGQYGHAVAAARYGAMAWQTATTEPPPPAGDIRDAAIQQMFARERAADQEELDALGVDSL